MQLTKKTNDQLVFIFKMTNKVRQISHRMEPRARTFSSQTRSVASKN